MEGTLYELENTGYPFGMPYSVLRRVDTDYLKRVIANWDEARFENDPEEYILALATKSGLLEELFPRARVDRDAYPFINKKERNAFHLLMGYVHFPDNEGRPHHDKLKVMVDI